MAGFSLGQIAALAVSGMVSERDAFRIAAFRAKVMAEAAAARPGSMCALLGGEPEEASEVCSSAAQGGVLVCANYNAPGQVVVSGDVAAIERAEKAWQALGKRGARLNTAGAFHSPLMASASNAVREKCSELSWKQPAVSVICNTDAQVFDISQAAIYFLLYFILVCRQFGTGIRPFVRILLILTKSFLLFFLRMQSCSSGYDTDCREETTT